MPRTPKQQVQQMLSAAAAACEDKKAEDIRILALDPAESGLTDYFLICTGMSDRQNVAITDEIELRLKRDFATYPNSVEGRRQGEWVLMDYVDFIVHVFNPEKRAFYGLERLRKSATVVSVAELDAELKSAIADTRKKAGTKPATKKTPGKSGSLPAKVTKKAASKRLSSNSGKKGAVTSTAGRTKKQAKKTN